MAWSLAAHRSTFEHRTVVLGRDRAALQDGLSALAAGEPSPLVESGVVPPGGTARVGFVFAGQGAQRAGMGRELYAASPVFAETFDRACVLLEAELGLPVREVVLSESEDPRADQTVFAQAGLFAVETGLVAMLAAAGIVPDAVAGHSVGEIAAAHAAGVLSLEDACKLVAARGRLMQALSVGGAMGALQVGEDEVRASLEGVSGVEIAAVNGPNAVVVSGDEAGVEQVIEHWRAQERRVRKLRVSHAFHSARMDPALDELTAVAAGLSHQTPTLLWAGAASGALITEPQASYWPEQARQPVRFADAVAALADQGVTVFVEIGPDATLTSMGPATLGEREGTFFPVLRPKTGVPESVMGAFARLHVAGAPLDWKAVLPAGRRVGLPTYAFAKQELWAMPAASSRPTKPSRPLELHTEARDAGSALGQRLAGLPEAEQDRVISDLVRTWVAGVLGHASPEEVDLDWPFGELGFTSLMAVELRDRLNAATGLRLSATLAFDHPTPAAVARHLRSRLVDGELVDLSAFAAHTSGTDDPIAVVGIGCRYPGGASSPEAFWKLLADGRDVVGQFPGNRGWNTDDLFDEDPDSAGKTHIQNGGFLHEADQFDAGFFGISPREALTMDPQQRLLLETTWEALERAGIDPAGLRGSRTAVFAGGTASRYGADQPEGALDGGLVTGTATSVLSGRISYTLGLEGPAMTVDTACSSGLVAVHLAAAALRSGEASLALAGSAFVTASPVMFTDFSRALGLAPDGRCKAFGAGADGMGVAEGAGMIVLERLSDARRNGHPVLALVAGSAVNQDGASNGLTAPNGPSQQRVIRAALASAGLSPADVDAVEAHGTGTPLGDPIEAGALIETYGQDRPEDRPLWLGSAKSNIGHAQQAAGSVGLIKMILALRNDLLPRTLHSEEPSPHIDWSAGAVSLLSEARAWPSELENEGRVRRAGVSAFGISGTNAHVILEEAPLENATVDPSIVGAPLLSEVPPVWLLSGRSAAALTAQTERLAAFAAEPTLDPVDVAWSLAATRSTHEYRAAVVGPVADSSSGARETTALAVSGTGAPAVSGTGVPAVSGTGVPAVSGTGVPTVSEAGLAVQTTNGTVAETARPDVPQAALLDGLTALLTGERTPGVIPGPANGTASGTGRVVFVFPGQGTQWLGMGRELAADSPLFAARLAECGRALAPHIDWSFDDVLNGVEGAPGIERADVVQPLLWAVMVSLAALWEAAGVRPEAVVGHSQGEIAAAVVSGALSLEDGARVVAVRGRALSSLAVSAGMLSVVMPVAAVEELLASKESWGERLSVAAVNGPATTVVSGDLDALDEFERALSKRRVLRWRIPQTDFVAHSARVEVLAEQIVSELEGIEPRAGRVPLYSTVTGERIDGSALDAAYWYSNVRERVRFQDAVVALASTGHRTFVEVSPQPVLTGPIGETFEELSGRPVIVGTLEREDAGARRFVTALAQAHVQGLKVDWLQVLPQGRRVDLPTYAFTRQSYWLKSLARQTVSEQPKREAVIEDWRYRVSWPLVAGADRVRLSGSWLLVTGEAGAASAAAVARMLGEFGATATVLSVDSLERETLLAGVGETGKLAGVLSFLALDETPVLDQVSAGLVGTMTLFQALGDAGIAAPLWVFTSGAVSTGPEDLLARTVQAQVWGFSRVAGIENPHRWGGLIDLPIDDLDELALHRVGAVLAGLREDAVAIRPSGIHARRLQRARRAGAPAGDWKPRGTVLITGGTGAIGRHVARWVAQRAEGPGALGAAPGLAGQSLVPGSSLVPAQPRGIGQSLTQPGDRLSDASLNGDPAALEAGPGRSVAAPSAGLETGLRAGRVVLTSRSGARAAGIAAFAAELAESGTTVDVIAADSANRSDLSGLLARIGSDLSSVMHTAGVVDNGVVDSLTPDRLGPVLAAKATSAQLLDELTAGLDLDAFVLFSSASATFGAGGQANYAAANHFLDALAQNRQGRGLPAVSVAWGPWAGGGVAAASEATRKRLSRNRWEVLMDPKPALRALADALEGPDSALTVMDIDWDLLATAGGETGLQHAPFVRDLPEVQRMNAAGAADGALSTQLAALSREEQLQNLIGVVQTEVGAVLDYSSPEDVDAGRAFSELGFDSLTSVELRNRLSGVTGLRLPAGLLFDHPTPSALAEYLRSELLGHVAEVAAVPVTAVDNEPIAIVGMGCRYPGGVSSPEQLWQLLASGTDAISGFPTDRGWDLQALYHPDPATAGTTYVQSGGFVHEAGEFDPAFFGISPREALAMDPQQRLLLEISWEALERAGVEPSSLRGSRTGVFAGGYSSNYAVVGAQTGHETADAIEGHLMAGNATSVISGRVSYVLGLEGPAVTMDTACSSSLVALHLAARALRSGECDLALAGGVTIMATPWDLVVFSRQRGLATDGRSKAFGASADGMGMAEGAGMIALERLSDARRNGHPVLAVLRGTAINQDGASNGLTAPNGPSQQRVIRAALADAQLTVDDVDVVEAHGTGTPLGDPIEAEALFSTYGRGRDQDRALWLGSVKSNIGHTQAAAGVAGVMKMVLALQHGELPRSLHNDEPTPHVDWASGGVRLLQAAVPWAAGERVRRAGVSAFGISGTNAHVIVEEAPAEVAGVDGIDAGGLGAGGFRAGGFEASGFEAGEPLTGKQSLAGACFVDTLYPAGNNRPSPDGVGEGADVTAPIGWLVSGHTPAALAGQARQLATYLKADQLELADVAYSLTRRTLLEHRAVVRGTSLDELMAGLSALAEGQSAANVVSGKAGRAKVGFVFAGQGAQKAGMGRELYNASPVFAEAFDRAAAAVEAELGHSIRDVVLAEASDEKPDPRADRTLYAQTGLFAVEVGLVAVLAAAGIRPDVVAGHSVGEIAAAHAAGVLSLDDAAKLIASRARLMEGLPDGGAMGAIEATEAEVRASLGGIEGIGIAAVNGPTAVVVSGDENAVEQVVEHWREQGRRVRRLRVSHAFHSARMEPVLEELTTVAQSLPHATPKLTWIGALTGEAVTEPTPGYWPKQAREAVRFADAVTSMADAGVSVVIEIGPDGTLSAMGAGVVGEQVEFVPVLRPRSQAADSLMAAFSHLHVNGAVVDWTRVLPAGRRVELPTYAFQNQRYWAVGPRKLRLDGGSAAVASTGSEAGFWSAVEDGDLSGLAKTLEMDDERLGELLPALTSWRRRELNRSATEGWRHRVVWAALADPEPATLEGTWLLVVPEAPNPLIQACVNGLRTAGAEVSVVHCSTTEVTRAELAAQIPADLAGVVSLLALDETPRADFAAVDGGLGANQNLVQALGDAESVAPLWIVTSGAVESVTNPAQAQNWGLGRVVGLEHPERWGGLVDLLPTADERAIARLVAVLSGALGDEDQIVIRDEALLGRRLEHAGAPEAERVWTPRGSTLITGGTGAIGGHVAHWLADRGAERIVLTSRSGAHAEGAVQRAAKLALQGTTVDVVQADISRRADVSGLVGWIQDSGLPLRAVMHTAGSGQATALAETSIEQLSAMAAVKTAGTRHLDELTADLDLDAFVLFSSISAVWGSGLQPGYAAVNAFLDALAENRRARGQTATSVAWGPWDGGGMSDREGKAAMVKRGLRLLDPEPAVRALSQALDADETTLVVADMDWATFAPAFTLRRPSPLIENLPEVREALQASSGGTETGETNELAEELAGLEPADQDRRLVELVRIQAAAVLSYPSPEDVDADRAFTDLGSDSLTAIELRNRLNTATGLRLSATLLFDHTSPRAVASHLRTLLVPEGLSAAQPVLSELDRLEEMLDGAVKGDADAAEAARITARLESVLARWKETRAGKGGEDVSKKLESSSDDEVFDFLGKELGIY
ncbi:hypothetical protein Kisp01_36080 [Kineosporia sp. NBRC 101677]|nr:hypothetical protein Kisp01_36080 [Kineosporia sp. NBRC 101677]